MMKVAERLLSYTCITHHQWLCQTISGSNITCCNLIFSLLELKPPHFSQNHSLHQVYDWIHDWQGRIGYTYPAADIIFALCPVSEPHSLLFLALQYVDQFHRFVCLSLSSLQINSLEVISQATCTRSHL